MSCVGSQKTQGARNALPYYLSERKEFMDANKLYDYAMNLRRDNDRTEAERKVLTDRSRALDSALHFIGNMLLYPRYGLTLADVPYELRREDSVLYVLGVRAVREIQPEKVADVFKLLWDDICNLRTDARHKKELIKFLNHHIHFYCMEEYPGVQLLVDKIQNEAL
jgi:hypothetical protein